MHKAILPALICLTAISVAPAAAQRRGAATTGVVTFAVTVQDPAGAPLPDVRVTATGPVSRTSRTERGRLVFEELPAGVYKFRFDKDGFVPFEREVTGRGSVPIDVKVTLTPLPPPPAPLPAPAPVPPSDHAVNAKLVVLDMPAFIEKNYVGRGAGKMTPLACSTGGSATLIQINEPLAEHTHADADEFLYVIAGQGTARVGDRQEALIPGAFMLIPRGATHTILTGAKKPLVLISMRAGDKCGG
jgi:mannose-6-phosphate isomerase-like protein (cupin superfamily)